MLRVATDREAIRQIVANRGRFALWLGAGASAEAHIPTADRICQDLRSELEQTRHGDEPVDLEEWANRTLAWNRPGRRYMRTIRAGRPNEAQRVSYFRAQLRNRQPSFAHHGAALLMSHGYVRRTCLTTNFDHLLEAAFMQQGNLEFQAIRSEHDAPYWLEGDDRSFIVKLHGDIDSHNILNTDHETMVIPEYVAEIVQRVTTDSGLVVIGSGGYEESVNDLFRKKLGRRVAGPTATLRYGLMWGVWMGGRKPEDFDSATEIEAAVRDLAVGDGDREGQIDDGIRELIDRSDNEAFFLFPVWGAGRFMLKLIDDLEDPELRRAAERHLDDEIRLEAKLRAKNLESAVIADHLANIRDKEKKLERQRSEHPRAVDEVGSIRNDATRVTVRVMYGDITSTELLGAIGRDGDGVSRPYRAVVSADDTSLSAGGGVALRLLQQAGAKPIRHELGKFSPVRQAEVVVTSAGDLPVHYIMHAAGLEIVDSGGKVGYDMTVADVEATISDVLRKCDALGVGWVAVPLLGTGSGPLSFDESFAALLDALRKWNATRQGDRLADVEVGVVVYARTQLGPDAIRKGLDALSGEGFGEIGR